jgi:hypothetical protein
MIMVRRRDGLVRIITGHTEIGFAHTTVEGGSWNVFGFETHNVWVSGAHKIGMWFISPLHRVGVKLKVAFCGLKARGAQIPIAS